MNKLKQYRDKSGKTRNELAADIGISVRYVAFLESGDRTPSLDVADKIARYFNATIEDIFLPSKCTYSTPERDQ